MKTLYIERSTGECRSGDWTQKLDLDGVERIVVGIGPGSFAGIRSALAFAQGYALGKKVEVKGLPSACSLTDGNCPLAVVGDARRGMYWIALFDGFHLVTPVFQVNEEMLYNRVPLGVNVKSPDDERIGAKLKELFAERYLGGEKPTAEGLKRFAEASPSILVDEPLPIYLNPAVR